MSSIHRSGISLVVAIVVFAGVAGCANRRQADMKRRMGEMPDKYKNDGAPQIGDVAYLFKLKTVEGDREVDISQVSGARPVALFFGSYT